MRHARDPRHRHLIVLRGSPARTRAEALAIVEPLDAGAVLWVSEAAAGGAFEPVRPNRVRRRLGQAFDAVVLDCHDGVEPDVLGQCHGFVWGGGSLVLRLPPVGEPPTGDLGRLAAPPYSADDVVPRFHRHFERALDRAPLTEPAPLAPVDHRVAGSADQARVVEQLTALMAGPTPQLAALVSDRGRGKSSALGLAIARARRRRALSVAVTAGWQEQTAEVLRFAGDDGDGDAVRFVGVHDLLAEDAPGFDVLVVDEAAQIPVPVLEQLVRRHPQATIAFATTARGYEGTGRGFMLRFLDWLRDEARPLTHLTLDTPVRWAADDPLERFVFDALLLDADLAPIAPLDADVDVEHVWFDRDQLVDDEATLRKLVGLLVHAHYRTTPGDVRRMLDAPNLDLHALRYDGHVVAANLVAREGELDEAGCEALYWGRGAIRGHALAETLAMHLGYRDAAKLRMRRSVRIATHPATRRAGLASRLIERVHAAYDTDLFGTVFGATPGLLAFRRSVGYTLVRLSASRGARTGEPSVTMLHPFTEPARQLVDRLRADLACDLPAQLELHEAAGRLTLDDRLREALTVDLGEPALREADELRRVVAHYAFGPRTLASVAAPLARFVEAHADALAELDDADRRLITARVLERRSWPETMAAADQPSLRVTMRALRRAVRKLVERVAPELEPR